MFLMWISVRIDEKAFWAQRRIEVVKINGVS
jgi:hypothetical protein